MNMGHVKSILKGKMSRECFEAGLRGLAEVPKRHSDTGSLRVKEGNPRRCLFTGLKAIVVKGKMRGNERRGR